MLIVLDFVRSIKFILDTIGWCWVLVIFIVRRPEFSSRTFSSCFMSETHPLTVVQLNSIMSDLYYHSTLKSFSRKNKLCVISQKSKNIFEKVEVLNITMWLWFRSFLGTKGRRVASGFPKYFKISSYLIEYLETGMMKVQPEKHSKGHLCRHPEHVIHRFINHVLFNSFPNILKEFEFWILMGTSPS